jgi:hypothetical protein
VINRLSIAAHLMERLLHSGKKVTGEKREKTSFLFSTYEHINYLAGRYT